MPTARLALTVSVGADGRIYAIGGTDRRDLLNVVEVYDIATNTWYSAASMHRARYNLGAATGLDGRIYAVGGFDGQYLATAEAYDPSTDSWTNVPSMHVAREAPGVATGLDGLIYAAGGQHVECIEYECFGIHTRTVEVFTP